MRFEKKLSKIEVANELKKRIFTELRFVDLEVLQSAGVVEMPDENFTQEEIEEEWESSDFEVVITFTSIEKIVGFLENDTSLGFKLTEDERDLLYYIKLKK